MKKLSRILNLLSTANLRQAGFTMIELLVVIAVIGVLAVAVLSSINPIEQINKGRDTRTRSDAAQLINAVDRYYAIHEKYPWNVDNGTFTAVVTEPEEAFTSGTLTPTTTVDWSWIDILVDTAEVKEGYVNRVAQDNKILVGKAVGYNETMYACFLPTSNAFEQEAMENCQDGTTPAGLSVGDPAVNACPNGTSAALDDDNLICLP